MAKVLRKPQAEADLIELWTYIAQDSLTSADKLLDKIVEKSQPLAQSTFIDKARDELGPKIRSFPIGNYVLFYQAIEDGIEIIRVLHGARYIEALFNPYMGIFQQRYVKSHNFLRTKCNITGYLDAQRWFVLRIR